MQAANIDRDTLVAPTPRYKLLVFSVLALLGVFFAFYIGLIYVAAHDLLRAFRLFSSQPVVAVVWAVPAVTLLGLLGGGLFAVRVGREDPGVELDETQQPGLRAFVDDIADRAGAPRAHRIFLTPEVNAAVFYDATLLNLVVPTRKNLIIGLGLVNTLSRAELEAVLAHEFGHFSQSSMRVGRYVQVANQIIAELVHARSWLDSILDFWARIDVRISWPAWILMALFWAIRTLLEGLFYVVNLPERALSREMEFHADKVSVSLTGSDALIHALARLSFADEALQSTFSDVAGDARMGRYTDDMFARQRQIFDAICARPDAELPDGVTGADARVFKASMSPPPAMWSSHPPNTDRESSAKQPYLPSTLDRTSAWDVFDDAGLARQQVTRFVNDKFLNMPDDAEVTAHTIDGIDLDAERFGGLHDLQLTREHAEPEPMIEPLELAGPDLAKALDTAYAGIAELTARRRMLVAELAELCDVHAGARESHDGAVLVHGHLEPVEQIPTLFHSGRDELQQVEAALTEARLRVRRTHATAAAHLGPEWQRLHGDAVAYLHLIEHEAARASNVQREMFDFIQAVIAGGGLSDEQVYAFQERISEYYYAVRDGLDLLEEISAPIAIDRPLRELVLSDPWPSPPNTAMFEPEWHEGFERTLDKVGAGLFAQARRATAHLVEVEDHIATAMRAPTPPPPPDFPPAVLPSPRPFLLVAADLVPTWQLPTQPEPQTALDRYGWDVGKGALALGVLGALFWVRGWGMAAPVVVYNGTSEIVRVDIGGDTMLLASGQHRELDINDERTLEVVATIEETGVELERFEVHAPTAGRTGLYNVGGAGLFGEVDIVYSTYPDYGSGPEPDFLGAPRWFETDADYILTEPPESIEMSGSRAVREYVYVASQGVPFEQRISWLYAESREEDAVRLADTWTRTNEPGRWLRTAITTIANQDPAAATDLLSALHAQHEDNVFVQRAYQDSLEDPHSAIPEYRELVAEQPTADNHYLLGRLLEDPNESLAEYNATLALDPDHALATCARAFTLVELSMADEADPALSRCADLDTDMRVFASDARLFMARVAGSRGWDTQMRELAAEAASMGVPQKYLFHLEHTYRVFEEPEIVDLLVEEAFPPDDIDLLVTAGKLPRAFAKLSQHKLSDSRVVGVALRAAGSKGASPTELLQLLKELDPAVMSLEDIALAWVLAEESEHSRAPTFRDALEGVRGYELLLAEPGSLEGYRFPGGMSARSREFVLGLAALRAGDDATFQRARELQPERYPYRP